ncbi:beta-propeller fold lactonase family protein [Thermaerobacillus caldiproteolyticus]|uniref:YVTN family beta-propeller protein n=1 Tax=Thermaerobacillus caldiproteolyticus TaxID=247480 RepID=A0A7V9Z4K9_9BACL|nr:beta-propeller fold lactonase family protein [Anoxybacillus caldiproteolyticus]MBA2873914.1 YVTN family beta-propeller protein [Anoxybacillus caldiproteolyticus]
MKRYLFIGILLLLWLTGCQASPVFESEKKVVRHYPVHSDNIAMNQKGDTLYIANIDVNSVTILNAKTKKKEAEIPVGKEPRQLALSPDEQWLYVSCMHDDRVDVISLKEKKVVDHLKTGIEPFGLVTSQDGKTLYVANYRSGTLSVFDLAAGKEKKEISIGDRPRALALTADGKKLYVTEYLDAKISVIDTKTNRVIKEIALAPSPDQADRKKSQGIPNTLEQIVIAPDGKKAYVPHLLTNIDTPINFEETVFPAISVIDLEKDEELTDERKELFAEINVSDVKNETIIVSNPYDIAFQPDGSKAYAIMSGSEDLVVFDLQRGGNATQILRRIEGNNPRGIVISPDGKTLFVHNAMSHDLAMIQTGGKSPYAKVKAVKGTIRLIAKDSLSPLVREGKTIFYSANSDEFATNITGNNWMSCASCHSDGDINKLTLLTPKGPRNVPSNILATKTGLFMWDGSRDDFTDYIHTVQNEMGGMMNLDPGKPLPPKVQHMYDAILAYLNDPNSFPVPKSPYRNQDGSLTAKAKEGEKLFNGKGNCLSCHGGEYFTDSTKAVDAKGNLTTANTDYLHDIGTANPQDKSSKGDARAHFTNPRTPKQWDTPTLRGVWATAPYLHDGSAKTIEEAIERHQTKEVETLTPGEIAAIAEYVRSIE